MDTFLVGVNPAIVCASEDPVGVVVSFISYIALRSSPEAGFARVAARLRESTRLQVVPLQFIVLQIEVGTAGLLRINGGLYELWI